MRRTLVAALMFALAATAAPAHAAVDRPVPAPVPTQPSLVLDRAEAALDGRVPGDHRPEATLALRDLFVSLPALRGDDRAHAERILARPTDGNQDPYGDGYKARSTRKCSDTICVHRVKRTADKASGRFASTTLRVLKKVWRAEVGRLGYRRPVKDGRLGGRGGKFDVYLKELGSQGLYGYCAPEYRVRDHPRLANAYCVLDNDFARSQYGGKPVDTLRVTAAHEFFHAIQFGYDYREDPWLMEATATWIEERFADDVNDNRQYLREGQVRLTHVPLDTFDRDRSFQYGNWTFFEYLSMRFGNGVVKRIWKGAGELRGDGGKYSLQAVRRALPDRVSLPDLYARYAAANATPGRSYPEGSSWPTPDWAGGGRLGRGDVASGRVRISHLAAHHFRLTPEAELDRSRFRLKVSVDGPARKTSPRMVLVRLTPGGDVVTTEVALDKAGEGSATVPFNTLRTERLFAVAVNASTRFECGSHGTRYSCRGKPRDERKLFALRFKVVSRR
ncbi:hypothetical protein GCM10009623_31720 [Nocardioides aestuarii]|uniref:MXAN_6640 family putative metalloprotease n=1 Tax=Nocardioides aestuarii TaxID=252231 RepID=A0ABW4TNT8_9ACTN